MSRNIRLFPTFSAKENHTTNHCLLILKMLYEENPKFLSEFLSLLLGDSFAGSVGVQFVQQRKLKLVNSIPDGEITQEAFSIVIETKLADNFGKIQLLNHLEGLHKEKQGQKTLIALGNFEQDIPPDSCFTEVIAKANEYKISFVAVSFEQFLQAIQLPYLSKNLMDAVSDLGEYLDENGLLPSWKYRLDVVNCARYFDLVKDHKIYTCPTEGAARKHRRSLYFGTYRHRCVELIAKIEAIVDLTSADESNLVWKNDSRSGSDLVNIAVERRQQTGESWYPVRVFVLGDLHPTDFKKTSPGGMFGNKQYFDVRSLKVENAEDLANKLNGKNWGNFQLI